MDSMSDNQKKLVVIGLGTGGMHTIRAAQRKDRNIDITVIEKRSYDMYSPCGLPYAVGKRIEDFESLKHTIPSTRRLHKLLSHEVKEINREEKIVKVRDLESGKEKTLPYDKLVIATGSRPRVLNIPGADKLRNKGIHVVSNPENALRLREEAEKSKKAFIIGGGAVGLEIGAALKELGLEVGITKRSLLPFPDSLDLDMAEKIIEYIDKRGCSLYFGKGIESINGTDHVESVTVDGEIIPTDLVVMAVGVNPEITLAEQAGLRIEKGAIWTDERMQTSDPDIYALGECALTFSGINKKPMKIDLATTAYKQAVIAGANVAGGDEKYLGTFGTFVSFVGDLEVASTGFNTETAMDQGFQVVSGRANLTNKPDYMPGAKEVSVKIIVDTETGRILGGQAVGEEGAAWRVNMIALAVMQKMTLETFSTVELAYCPAVSELYDPLQAAVDVALKRLDIAQKRK